MADQRPPSFFHILMNPSSPHLPLPHKFVTKHLGNKILEDPIIKSANGGYLWKLKMKKVSDQSYCFVDGWCNVVKDVGLLFGEFLLFRYVGSSVFLMHVYSVNGCEKILVPKIKVVDYGFIGDDDDDVDDEVEEEDDVVYDVDDDNDVELVHDGDEDDGMEEEDDVVYDVDDDNDVEFVNDGEDDDMEEVEDEDDVELVHDGDEDDGMEEDDDVLYDVDDDDADDVEDEDDIEFIYEVDEDGDVDVDGDDGDPFFILTISKSNTNKLLFSPDFVELARIDTRETITLKNDEGYEKEMIVQSDKKSKSTSYYVAAGWKEFQQSNDISQGDKCVFKFIRSEDKICLAKITKKKTPARPLPPAAETPLTEVDADDVEDDDGMDDKDTKDDNDKDEGEDVELVDETDPFFVVTITPTYNNVLRMPADFVRSAGIDTKRTLTLRGLDGYEMAIPVQFDTQYGCLAKRYFLLEGWKDFMQGTNISEGDKCVFKFITSEDKLCLAKITKPPLAAEVPASEVNGDDDKDENENEDVEPVDDGDDVDPFFVATITTSHKFRLYLPIDFVRLSRIDSKKNIIMISLDGSESQMAVQKDKRQRSTHYHLSEGWHAFMRSNNIAQGDKCVFKYITSEDKICLAKIIKALAMEVDVKDVNPSFVVTITTMHTTRLPLPPDFIALAGIDTKENIIMKNLDGNESQMAVWLEKRFNSAQYNLSLGWVAFKQSNNISQGDECVFKYIMSEDKMCLVKITKASATEVNDGMDVEDDNDTDEDENVKLVDDADPFFAVTIIPSQRSVLLLPTDFVASARIGTKKNIIIKSLDGNETQMTLHSYKLKWSTRYCFSVGWTAFKRSNNISVGDECVLKYIKSEDKMCLAKITKKTTGATLLPAEVDNNDMDDEDVNEEGKGEDAKLVDEDDNNESEEDDYDYDGDDGDPSFILTISKANQYKLRFSPDFVALARIDTRETITLKNDDGYEKEMPVQSDKRRKSTSYYVAAGWKEFQKSNGISEGDKCVFKFIPSEDKIYLANITKKKTPSRPLPPAAEAPMTEVDADDDGMDDKDAEDGNDKDEDEDAELVDVVDPFFVATITTSNNRRLYLPNDFVELDRIVTKKNIIMISLDGNECQMAVRKDKRKLSTRYHLSKGWHAFMRSNNISHGDKCVFKYITSEDKMCLAKMIKAQAKKVDSFVVTITAMNKTMLRFLPEFVTLTGIDKKKTIVFKNLNGYEKEMAVQPDNQFKLTSYFVASGWKEFLRNTDILEGDICVFKFIRSEDKICLAKITKKKTPASPPPPAIEPPVTEVDDDDDDDAVADNDEIEDVERVDDGDPFFVATIVPTRNHELYMPVDFVRSAGIGTKKTLTLLGLDGYEKEMHVRCCKNGDYYMHKGWSEFKRNNGILEGDKCVFKFITDNDKLCLAKINKKKTPTSPLPSATDDDNDDDENEDVERVDGEDPFFVATISHKFMLRLPSDFVALAKIDTKENIILKSLDGNERQMAIQSYQYRLKQYHFSKGWPAFRRSNNISQGDECVFKYIRSEDKMCLVKVTKRKTQARSSPPATESEVDADDAEDDDGLDDKDAEDDNEDAELVDDDDPFFVVTITQYKFKHRLRMPVDFVRSAGIDTKKTITLKSPDGYEKELPVQFYTKYHYQAKYYFLRKGWMDFARSTNMSVGDKCVFKFITSEDKLCLAKITKTSPTEVDDDDVEVDSGMDDKDADKDVELVNGVDVDPFFVVTITTTAMLRLPSTFVRLSGIDTKKNIIIKSLDGNERLMALQFYQKNNFTHYWLSIGLPAFMRSNSISEGDECVFKYITSEDKMCLAKVTKTKTQTRLSSPAKVVKRKRGRPAKVVMRKRGRPAKITMAENVKITVADVVKRKRGRPAKVVMRKRGRPAKITMAEDVKITVADVVKRKRGRPPASPRVIDDVKKKNGQQPCGHSGDLEGVDMCVEVGKRPLGRPAKRLCGNAPQHK